MATKILTDSNGKALVNSQGKAYIAPGGGGTPVSHPNPTISVNTSTGLITASHTQESGEVTGGTTTATEQLTTQGAQTITPTTSDQTIAAGKYLTGAQTIKGDANLVAGNIASGVTIFGVTGTHSGGGSGGETVTVNIIVPDAQAYFMNGNGEIVNGTLDVVQTSLTCLKGSMLVVFVMGSNKPSSTSNVQEIASLTLGSRATFRYAIIYQVNPN